MGQKTEEGNSDSGGEGDDSHGVSEKTVWIFRKSIRVKLTR